MTSQPTPSYEEQEVDFRRYGALLAARWWIVLAGLVAGLAAGYLLAFGGGSIWKAEALVSLGQPFTPGGAPLNYYTSNPRNIGEIVHSESAQKQAAHIAHMSPSSLSGHVATAEVGTGSTSGTGRAVPLIAVTVQGRHPAKVAAAANELAQIVVDRTTKPYVGKKVISIEQHLKSLQGRINSETQTVTQLQAAASVKSLSPLDRVSLVLQLNAGTQLLGQLKDEQTNAQQQLALAQNVESATIVSKADAVKTSARSTGTSTLIGGLIGLILGMIAAILWEPLAARFATRPAA